MQKLIINYTEAKKVTTSVHLRQAHTKPSLMVEVYIAQMKYNCVKKHFHFNDFWQLPLKNKNIQVIHPAWCGWGYCCPPRRHLWHHHVSGGGGHGWLGALLDQLETPAVMNDSRDRRESALTALFVIIPSLLRTLNSGQLSL